MAATAGTARMVEVVQGPSHDELLTKYNETMEDVFEKVEDVTNNSQGGASRDRMLQRDDLRHLGKKTKELVSRGIMRRVDAADVVRLLDVLVTQMTLGEGVDIDEGDKERSEEVQDVLKALDAVLY